MKNQGKDKQKLNFSVLYKFQYPSEGKKTFRKGV